MYTVPQRNSEIECRIHRRATVVNTTLNVVQDMHSEW